MKDETIDWPSLGQRADAICCAFDSAGIKVPNSSDLAKCLEKSKALSAAEHCHDVDDARSASIIWALSDNLEELRKVSFDFSHHLRQMPSGSTTFGKVEADKRRIQFKDFEFELAVAAHLARQNVPINRPTLANDPLADLECGSIAIQAKHPDSRSVKRFVKSAATFQKRLRESGRFGILASGLEDAFAADPGNANRTGSDYGAWIEEKQREIEAAGREILPKVCRFNRILGIVQSLTVIRFSGGTIRLIRYGNATAFDGLNSATEQTRNDAVRVLESFNPDYFGYSCPPRSLGRLTD